MSPDQQQQLDQAGFVVLPDYFDGHQLAALRQRVEELFAAEGESAGAEFKQEPYSRRLANLVDKGELFADLVDSPQVLTLVRHILGPEVKLSSLNARSADPLNDWTQPLHADMGAIADEHGYWVANTVWLLDDFTEQNGALRIVPGSHRWKRLPEGDPEELRADHPEQVLVTGRAGSVVVMNAHAWHGGTANRTETPRRAIHVFYCRRDKPQQQYQKQLISGAVQAGLRPQLRDLLALDDPHNDELCRQATQRSGFLK